LDIKYYHISSRINFIGKGLGQLKIEYIISKGVFLAPKIYSLITDLGKIVTKVKGFKESNIGFDIFESLLNKGITTSLIRPFICFII